MSGENIKNLGLKKIIIKLLITNGLVTFEYLKFLSVA